MFCEHCGTRLGASGRFCPSCGQDAGLEERPVADVDLSRQPQPLNVSPNIPATTSLRPPAPRQQSPSIEVGQREGRALAVAFICALTSFVAFAGGWLWGYRSGAADFARWAEARLAFGGIAAGILGILTGGVAGGTRAPDGLLGFMTNSPLLYGALIVILLVVAAGLVSAAYTSAREGQI